jgi:uncharacterized protein
MTSYTPPPEFQITDEAALRAMFPATHDLAIKKVLTTLDHHASDFIARAPFLCIGTQNADGTADVSPRGDPPGFVRIVDPYTLAIPDRPGNNRLDTLSNILTNPKVGLLFIVPGFDETLRVNGTASLVSDPTLLSTMAVRDRVPTVAIVVKVAEVFLHCAKAFRRSSLWDPASLQNRKEMPSLINLILDQTTGAPTDPAARQANDEAIEASYQKSMY